SLSRGLPEAGSARDFIRVIRLIRGQTGGAARSEGTTNDTNCTKGRSEKVALTRAPRGRECKGFHSRHSSYSWSDRPRCAAGGGPRKTRMVRKGGASMGSRIWLKNSSSPAHAAQLTPLQ